MGGFVVVTLGEVVEGVVVVEVVVLGWQVHSGHCTSWKISTLHSSLVMLQGTEQKGFSTDFEKMTQSSRMTNSR